MKLASRRLSMSTCNKGSILTVHTFQSWLQRFSQCSTKILSPRMKLTTGWKRIDRRPKTDPSKFGSSCQSMCPILRPMFHSAISILNTLIYTAIINDLPDEKYCGLVPRYHYV